MLYNKKLPELTNTHDSMLSVEYDDLVVLWACYLMFISVEKQAKATMCLGQYSVNKDSIFTQVMNDDDSITFSTQRS